MANQKVFQLLENIKNATIEERVEWEASPSGSGFRLSLGSAEFEIEEEGAGGQSFSYVIYIKDKLGKTLEVEFFDPGSNSEYFPLAKEIYELARKNALKLDQIIDSMITDIMHAERRVKKQ